MKCTVIALTLLLTVATASQASAALAEVRSLYLQGQYQEALNLLEQSDADATAGATHQAWRGALQLALGRPAGAITTLEQALSESGALSPGDAAAAANDLGRAHMQLGDPIAASAAYQRALTLGEDLPEGTRTRYQLNYARALAARTNFDEAAAIAARLEPALAAAPNSKESVQQQISLGLLQREIGVERPAMTAKALGTLQRSARAASALQSAHQESYALGLMGEIYEDNAQFQDALAAGRAALARAEDPAATYRWEWLTARAHRALGNDAGALGAYRRATVAIRQVRGAVEAQSGSFRASVGDLYYEYADTLFKAASAGDSQRTALLIEARDAVEELKFAEVEDYFGEQCLAARSRSEEVQRLDPTAVVLYPMVFDERIELLVSHPGGLSEHRVAVSKRELERLVRRFRSGLAAGATDDRHLAPAQALHRLLIEPIEPTLEALRPQTLVFVPDGALRTVPVSALHDGERYLIERFAVATSPGLTLTDPRGLSEEGLGLFAGGLSESVQGFAALPGVERELDFLASGFQSPVIRNEQFSVDRLTQALQEGGYQIAHFATHGKFGSSYQDSFLLTYDSRLTVDQLSAGIQSRRLASGPLEMLVMSACETAAGDDRAALGLAGLALRAGARSALATLWAVDDDATVALIQAFYATLTAPETSRAQSLREAQLALLRGTEFEHPSYWSPFLLLGSWL